MQEIRKCPKCLLPGRGLTLVTKSPTDLELEIKINNQGCTNAMMTGITLYLLIPF